MKRKVSMKDKIKTILQKTFLIAILDFEIIYNVQKWFLGQPFCGFNFTKTKIRLLVD